MERMALFDAHEIEHLAELSRMALVKTEEGRLAKDLNAIIGHFKELSALPSAPAAPLGTITGIKNVFREDVRPAEPARDMRERIRAAFPEESEGYIKVPKVL
jgi:aspartyl/glutamyl-tRNA(Asn/Gln) amidotransferase C subunit